MNCRLANLQNLESLQQHLFSDEAANNVQDEALLSAHSHTKFDFSTIEGVFAGMHPPAPVPHGFIMQTKKITHCAVFRASARIRPDFYWFSDEKNPYFSFGSNALAG